MNKDTLFGLPRVLLTALTIISTVVILSYGRELLVPWSMAVLLTFLLTPLVKALERRRLPRVPAVIGALLVLFIAVAAVGGAIETQFIDLADKLPTYRQNMRTKIGDLNFSSGTFSSLREIFNDLDARLSRPHEPAQRVRVVVDQDTSVEQIKSVFLSVAGPLVDAGVVLVLVMFMLIRREDLRNRLVRLAGTRLALTTRTLDEVGSRISKYLLLNALVNTAYGICVAIGLFFIGVDYALMWGFLAGTLRFIPYLGPMVGSAMPMAMAFIQFPAHEWLPLVFTGSLFLALELILNSIIEPLAYGPSMGVSTVAVLVAAMFWSWVWGPIGLLLAVPLTVVLTVLGEHIAALEPIAILLGDKPPLAGYISYYQRLLAGDGDEAYEIFDTAAKNVSRIDAFDNIIIPALALSDFDAHSGELTTGEQQAIWQTSREIIEELSTFPEKKIATDQASEDLRIHVVGCPAHDFADELALSMLKQSIPTAGNGELEVLPVTMLVSEMMNRIEKVRPDLIFISSLGPIGIRQSRYLCIRMKQKFPDIRIIVGQWGYRRDREKMIESFKARGADQVVTSLVAAIDQLDRIMPQTTTVDAPAKSKSAA